MEIGIYNGQGLGQVNNPVGWRVVDQYFYFLYALVAQLTEQQTLNLKVVGSNPTGSTDYNTLIAQLDRAIDF